MYLNDTESLNAAAKQKLDQWRQDAAIHRRLRPLKRSYRSSLAKWLNAAAERLDPNLKPQHLGS